MKPRQFCGQHLQTTHGLNLEEYKELIKFQTKLQEFKIVNGFTDKLGECGFCMKQFSSFAYLRHHRSRMHNKRGVEKGTKANKNQLPTPGKKSSERKGVSLTSPLTLSYIYVQFDMGLMRKMRDERKFKNPMLAEIEQDELLVKMAQQVDEIQDDLEVRIPANTVTRLILLFRRKSLTFSKRPSAKTYPWTRLRRRSEMIGSIPAAWTIICKLSLTTDLSFTSLNKLLFRDSSQGFIVKFFQTFGKRFTTVRYLVFNKKIPS